MNKWVPYNYSPKRTMIMMVPLLEAISQTQVYLFPRSNKCITIPLIFSLKIGLKDFEFIDVLGVGAYGAVWKVRKVKTNDIYAMKVIDT